MCGIAGIVSLNNSKIDSTVVENVKRSLEHRGPDHSSHQFINDSVCLIHTRLSIIDLNDRSNQPFQSNDCLLYTSPSPRDRQKSRMPSSA